VTEFTYTDPYGREFVMEADGALKSIRDLNDNTLTFTEDGITSSAGLSCRLCATARTHRADHGPDGSRLPLRV
jgi:hypothetical protein